MLNPKDIGKYGRDFIRALLRVLLRMLRPRRLFRRLQRRTPNRYKPVILVTGCGSGLGLAIATRLYGIDDYRLVITARSRSIEFLHRRFLESDRVIIRALDVTSEVDRDKVCAEVTSRWGGVDILINNAGISYRAVVEHMTDQDELRQLSANYLGPMGLIRRVIEPMRIKGRGKIINVSSVSGMLSMPTMASYSASKHALEGASEALWYEMRPLGIDVCLIQPGFINSDSFLKVRYTPLAVAAETGNLPYSDYYRRMTPFIDEMMRRSNVEPSDLAETVLKVIRTENPPLWIAATPDAKLFYYLRRLIPRRWLLPFLFLCLPQSDRWASSYTQRRKSLL